MSSRRKVLLAHASRLAGEAVLAVDSLPCSGNSRLYCVHTATSRFALKSYIREGAVLRRIDREYDALLFLNANGAAGSVPRAQAVDRPAGFALYEWIDGTQLTTHDAGDIDKALDFIACAHVASAVPAAQALQAAKEACTSSTLLFTQVASRIDRLRSTVGENSVVGRFLSRELRPCFDFFADECRRTARCAGLDGGGMFQPAAYTLSPSDFSFHNALRRSDGSVVFLDFEYFGWDDPVKLVSDFLWHPAMVIAPEAAARFARGAASIFMANDADYTRRLHAYFPLFGIKWCLIVLNEFFVDVWKRRRFAGESRLWEDVKVTQFAKARDLLREIGDGSRQRLLC